MSSLAKWWRFTRERFDPLSHTIMITLFVLTHWVVAVALGDGSRLAERPGLLPLLWLGTLAFFYKLRLYDEIKDYELDCVINPTRPLARGLLKHIDLYRGIGLCICLELLCFGLSGSTGFMAMGFAVLYSLLMYKEFFIREAIRPHLTTYAVLHTVVSCFLSLALFAALAERTPLRIDPRLWFFALNSWFLFNVFEFGRKTFLSSEERPGVESYSKIFSRFGAALLTLSMAIGSSFCLLKSFGWDLTAQMPIYRSFLISTDAGVFIIGGLYAFTNQKPLGKAFRSLSSFYIVWVYLSVLILLRGFLPW